MNYAHAYQRRNSIAATSLDVRLASLSQIPKDYIRMELLLFGRRVIIDSIEIDR
jgi:hypothetical protein